MRLFWFFTTISRLVTVTPLVLYSNHTHRTVDVKAFVQELHEHLVLNLSHTAVFPTVIEKIS